MAAPIKISSVITNTGSNDCYAVGQGCHKCGETNNNKCYQCSNDPSNCVCEISKPSARKCKGGNWVEQTPPPKTPPTEMEMMTEQVSLVSMTQYDREKCGWLCIGDQIANPLYIFTDEYKQCQARCDREELGRQGFTQKM